MALWHECGRLDAIVSESRELTRAALATAVASVARTTPLLVTVLPTSQMDSRPADRDCPVIGDHVALFRHSWIVTKLLLTALATIILLVHT
jgi:hypothetical protein